MLFRFCLSGFAFGWVVETGCPILKSIAFSEALFKLNILLLTGMTRVLLGKQNILSVYNLYDFYANLTKYK